MGTKGIELVGVDLKKLLSLLNRAYADEWLAHYQYWVGAKVVVGLLREPIAAELGQHALDELRHAEMLTKRILQLGGLPLLSPEAWSKETNCGYDAPSDPQGKKLLEQNIKGEQCAISVYTKLLAFVKDKDIVTYNIIAEILKDEIEHEDDLENLLNDLKSALK